MTQLQPPRRILVVDDSVDACESLALILEMEGFEVHMAHSGRAAIEAVQAHDPEAVLLDVGLPDIDGLALARQLRATRRARQPILVGISGYGASSDRQAAADAGFDHYLVKPVDPERVVALLRTELPDGESR